jgi:hypothetical protein
LRVHRFLPVPNVTKSTEARDRAILELTSRLKDQAWAAATASSAAKESAEITTLSSGVAAATKAGLSPLQTGIVGVAALGKLPAAKGADAGTQAAAGKNAKDNSYGVSDNFEALDVTVSAYQQDKMAAVARSGMPPMLEGDQFAIDDLQRLPTSAAAPAASYSSGQNYSAQGTAGFAGTDADLSAVIPSLATEEDIADISAVELPEGITAMLAQSAQKLNDGLRGKRTERR